jgi:hypothetical protein
MGTDKGFRSTGELLSSLADAGRRLTEGSIGLEGLDRACDEAREVYERLVVLRHKAREARRDEASAKPAPQAPTPPHAPPAPAKEAAPVVEEPPPIRLDTRPGEKAPKQTSLIEAIAETEKPRAADKPAAGKAATAGQAKPPAPKTAEAPAKAADAAPSVAERLGRAPISNLGRSIALSQKFWFVAELFNNDRIHYDRSIDLLDAMGALQEAKDYIDKEVLARMPAPPGEEVLAAFMDLVERRFR